MNKELHFSKIDIHSEHDKTGASSHPDVNTKSRLAN